MWDSIAYDPDADLIYFGTGNAGPWPFSNDLRNSKGKDNLYVCSIIAINANTGEYKWHFQTVPGDTWDYDSVAQLILADMTIKGQPRKVIMQANKNGFFYELDRITGKFISGQPFVKVTWAKGLDEATGKPIVNEEAYYDKENAATVMPGPNGAHNWAPMSFNPTTGLVYIPSTSGITFNYATDPNFEYKPGQLNLGVAMGGRRPRRSPVVEARARRRMRRAAKSPTAAAAAANARLPRFPSKKAGNQHEQAAAGASGDRTGTSESKTPEMRRIGGFFSVGSGDAEAHVGTARRAEEHRRRNGDHGGKPGDPGSDHWAAPRPRQDKGEKLLWRSRPI